MLIVSIKGRTMLTAIVTGSILACIALYKTMQALGELGRELYRIERVMRKIEEIK